MLTDDAQRAETSVIIESNPPSAIIIGNETRVNFRRARAPRHVNGSPLVRSALFDV